jgi:mRNA-degrading endonuclease RelE of RelBE toxin-antitoxin system
MYTIELTKKAKNFLLNLAKDDQEAILKKIYTLRENPQSHLKKLVGSKLWRLRVGKYRAIIDIIIKGKRLIVLRIGKRDKVY